LTDGPITLPLGAARLNVGDAVKLGVRPEDFSLAGDGESARAFDGRVTLVEPLGSETIAHIGIDGAADAMVVKLPGEVVVAAGQAIRIAVDPARCHLFDRDGVAVAPPGA
jgi:multiple sugar transport system ATP-binding protein